MSIIFIGGVYDTINEKEVINNTKHWVDFSGNNFQRKILSGFEKCDIPLTVFSTPSIGSYPNNYRRMFFKGFKNPSSKYQYINFFNLWGIRNISRSHNLKKSIKKYGVNNIDKIIVYSVHTPFLKAAVYAKKKNPNIRICLIVPDIPEYMNLNSKKTFIYKVLKKYDISKFYKLNKKADSYVFLTNAMNEIFNVRSVPFIIQEGFNDLELKRFNEDKRKKKHIVYAGKLNEKFGLKNLVDAFMMIKDDNLVLDICGDGEMLEKIKEYSLKDVRIICYGPLAKNEMDSVKENATIFVNPRQNNEEYTKYSFPSKNIEYLVTGKPVVAYLLDGMSQKYADFLWIPKDDSVSSLSSTILNAIYGDNNVRNDQFIEYAKEHLDSKQVARKILNL